jgi:hypothetical protein
VDLGGIGNGLVAPGGCSGCESEDGDSGELHFDGFGIIYFDK